MFFAGLEAGFMGSSQPKPFGCRRWEPEEDELVRQAIGDGITRAQALRRFKDAPSPFDDRTYRAISMRAKKLGLHFRDVAPRPWHFAGYIDWTARRIANAMAWWQAGWAASAIAKELGGGVTKNAVIGKMTRLKCFKPRAKVKRKSRQPKPRQRRRSWSKPPPGKFILTPINGRGAWLYPPKAPSLPAVPACDVAHVAHNDLTTKHCRWPVGDPREVAIHKSPFFCGAPREDGLPYCREHCCRAFTEISAMPRQTYPTPGIL